MKPRYPEIHVPLSGEDGNAFFIIGRVRRALRKAKVSSEEIEAFTREANSGDYDRVLLTTMQWVSTS